MGRVQLDWQADALCAVQCTRVASQPAWRCLQAAVLCGLLQCAQGTPIKSGQEIRLQHIVTRRWLHSHLFSSPLSNNQEVCVCVLGCTSPPVFEMLARHPPPRTAGHALATCIAGLPRPQVSCFGDDKNTDSGDVWRVEWDGAAATWQRDMPVRLLHKDTGAFLSTHAVKYQRCALVWWPD